MASPLDALLENKGCCRVIGIFLVVPYISWCFSEYPGADSDGIIFSVGWFREVLACSIVLMAALGCILILAGFSKRSRHDP